MTATDTPTAATPVATATDLADPGPQPVVLTLAVLRTLAVCGQYLRTFGRLFPDSEYPGGVTLTAELCARHADEFDWHWALDTFLSWTGREEYDRLVRSRAAEYRRFGTGDVRRATVVGHLVAHRPDLRSARLLDATVRADQRADERALRDLDRARRQLAEAEQLTTQYARLADERRAALLALEAAAAGAVARRAARVRDERARDLARVEAELAAARARLAEADAALADATAPADAAPAAEATS